MLAFKPCNSVLVASDFLDDLEEVSPKSVTSASGTTADVSSCKYASTEKELSVSHVAEFTEGGIGVECLANGIKIAGQGASAPPGGCYRIDNASVLFCIRAGGGKARVEAAEGREGPHMACELRKARSERSGQQGGIRL